MMLENVRRRRRSDCDGLPLPKNGKVVVVGSASNRSKACMEGWVYGPCNPQFLRAPAMTNETVVPFLPFTRPSVDEAAIAEVSDVLRSGWLTSNGPKVRGFESALSEYFSGRPVRTFNSGTCTMEIALRIAGIGPGDEVITTPNSWVATANVILEVGAQPVFADIDPRSPLMEPLASAECNPLTVR
jgi:hypothetical protein